MADLEVGLDLDTGPFEKKARALPKTFGSVVNEMAKSWGILSLAMGAKGVSAAADFERAMAKIASLGTSKGDLAKLRKSILDLPPSLGSATEAAESTFQALADLGQEAGVERVMGTVVTSAKLAKAGMADLGETTKALTGFLGAYKEKSVGLVEVSDLMAKAVDVGRVEIADLVAGLGQVAPVAAAAGISQRELLAAIATITLDGKPANEAITQLKDTIVSLVKPTSMAQKAAEKLGIEGFGLAMLQSKGLHGTMVELERATHGNVTELGHLMHGSNALGGALSLSKGHGESFKNTLDKIDDSAGKTQFAFETMTSGTMGNFEKLSNSVNKLFIAVGDELLPPINHAVETLLNNMSLLKGGFDLLMTPVTALSAAGGFIGKHAANIGMAAKLQFGGQSDKASKIMESEYGLTDQSVKNVKAAASDAAMSSLPFGLGSLFQSGKAFFGGGRAAGGPVGPGEAVSVGERGRETLLMGKGGGLVLPGSAGLGGGVSDSRNARRSGRTLPGSAGVGGGQTGFGDWLNDWSAALEMATEEGFSRGVPKGARKGMGGDGKKGGKGGASEVFDGMLDSSAKGLAAGIMSGDVKGGIKNFGKGLADTAKSMLSQALSSALSGLLGGFGGKLFGKLKLFGGGGDIEPNEPAIVGDKGPEIFMSRRPGTIVSNQDARAALSGGGGTNLYVDKVVLQAGRGPGDVQTAEGMMAEIARRARSGRDPSNYFPREIEARR